MSQLFLTEPLTLSIQEPCPLCEADEKVTDLYTGEEICTSCGCVLNDKPLNRGKDMINYTGRNEVDKRRHGTGSRPSIYDKGLNTFINGNKDAYGTPLRQEKITEMKRLQRQDNRSKINESVMRNLSVAMAELDRMCSALNLSRNVKEDAAVIYRRALKKDLVRGRSIDAFVAASIYTSCRLRNIPRPLKTVCEESKRTYKEVSMTYRFLLKELNIKTPLDSPVKYIPSIASRLDIPAQTERKACDLLQAAKKRKALMGKDPRGVAAAALYLASELNGEKIVQRNVAKVAETTEVTLRNRYRGLKKALNIV